MSKKISVSLIILMIFSVTAVTAASNTVGILLNHEVLGGAEAYIDSDNNVLLPIRTICENLNYEVSWYDDEKAVGITNSDTEILLYVGAETCLYNGETKEISAPVVNNDGTTYLEYYALISMLDNSYIAQYWDDEEYMDTVSENGFISIYQANILTVTAEGVVDWRGNVLSEDDIRDLGYSEKDIEIFMSEVAELQTQEEYSANGFAGITR